MSKKEDSNIGFNERTDLLGSERKPLAESNIVGDPNPNEVIQITIGVRSKSQGTLREKLTMLNTNSDKYDIGNNQISREQFESSYGADPQDMRKVMEFAQNNNLTVIESSIARRQIRLQGTVSSISKAFGVTLQQAIQNGKKIRMRTGSIQIPSELKQIVTNVMDIDNRKVANHHSRLMQQSVVFDIQSGGNQFVTFAASDRSSFTPIQLKKLYNFQTSENDGDGQCIGIIELGGFHNLDDLKEYFSKIGIETPKITAISVDGAHYIPGEDPGADGEVMLDIIVAAAIAPKAKIAVYYAPNTDAGFLDAVSKAVHDKINQPSVISISWGGPEYSWTEQSLAAYNQTFGEAALLGVTVCAASGDDNASDLRPVSMNGEVDDDFVHVDFPSSSPFVLSCGGTKLTSSGDQIQDEAVWNDSFADNGGGTGGGISDVFPVPPYQKNIKMPPSLSTVSNGGGRGLPDVSGDASPLSGYKVRVNGRDMVIGGTSAVAPLWAGIIAIINQKIGKSLGYFYPILYEKIGPNGTLRDIVKGDNSANNVRVKDKGIETIKGYSASKGWNACTGWGSPDGLKLLTVLNNAAGMPDIQQGQLPMENPSIQEDYIKSAYELLGWNIRQLENSVNLDKLEHLTGMAMPLAIDRGISDTLKQKGYEFLKKLWPQLLSEACSWWNQNKDKNLTELFQLQGLISVLGNALPFPYKFIPGILTVIASLILHAGLNTLCEKSVAELPAPTST